MLLMCYVAFIYIISYGNHLSYFSMEKNEKKKQKNKKNMNEGSERILKWIYSRVTNPGYKDESDNNCDK